MKSYRYSLVFLICTALIMPALVQAQVVDTWNEVIEETRGDTAVVLPGFGTLNDATAGDTTATGERANPDRVYELKRGTYYYLSGDVSGKESKLDIVGQKEDPANPTFPAIVCSGVNEDGSRATGELIDTDGDVTVKNFALINYAPNGSQGFRTVQMNGDSSRLVIDNMIVSRTNWHTFACYGEWYDVFATNTIWVDGGVNVYNGRGICWDPEGLNVDTLIVENCTFYNNIGQQIKPWNDIVNFMWINHNTFLHTMKSPLWTKSYMNAYITNNVFHDVNCYGVAEFEVETNGWDVFDYQPFATVNVDTIEAIAVLEPWVGDTAEAWYPEAEAERRMLVHNNLHYRSDIIMDQINSFTTDSMPEYPGWVECPWMDERTEGIFADDETWPHMVRGDLYDEQLNFASEETNKELMTQYMRDEKAGAGHDTLYFWDPDGDPLLLTWPLHYDLSYTNSEPLTAAYGDLPLGDLNWFPEKKKEWESIKDQERADFVDIVDAGQVAIEEAVTKPHKFQLKQNYPNPFNPTTNIEFKLKRADKVKLSIYNMLGQKVRTLVSKDMTPGAHKIQWNATNDLGEKVVSGVYFYKLQAGNHTETRKMLLLK
mgnify:CR=1 FL=1